MKYWIIETLLLSVVTPGLFAQVNLIRIPRDYFFPPPRGLYYFRPDLYVQERIYQQHYNYPRYHRPWGYPVGPLPRWDYGGIPYHPGFEQPRIYRLFLNAPETGGVVQVNTSDIVFNVVPKNALIFVDEMLIGSARDFATERDRFNLLDGEHRLRIESPGHIPFETNLNIVPNKRLHLEIVLDPKP